MDAWEVPLADDDDFPDKPMRIIKSVPDSTGDAETPPTFINAESHWWDCSGIYGRSIQIEQTLRSGENGKLKTETIDIAGRPDQRLLQNPDARFPGIDHTGFFDNYWIGLSMLHTLFSLEHNAICDALKQEYPTWSDEQLYQTARLINCALIAKIHTVEWTPGILSHPALKVSMNANWWGLLGENLKKNMGRLSDTEELSGIIGSDTDHHTASYALTEEFTSVYRLHPLIPDNILIRDVRSGDVVSDNSFTDLQGNATRPAMAEVTLADLFYSFGVSHPGAIRLANYPDTLRHFQRINSREPPMDLAAVDILRDRERGVPRYNRFRTLLHMKPVRSFSDITSNKGWAATMKELYDGDVNKVDLMVGLLAEDLPEGFGFSDTAFRIFILMASRRLKSDRFFTRDYNEKTYTRLGLDWIDNNGMASVLQRHCPELAPALHDVANPFAPWNTVDSTRPIADQDT
ncbi:MAG: peroxidase family protein, partial [Gammaproteobacteria bacterium]